MTVDDATDVLDPSRPDVSRPGGREVPPFPVFDAPGTPERASDASTVHREVTYARAIGFRPLKMDIWLPRNASGPVPLVLWVHGGAFQLGDRRELPPTFAPNSVFRLLNEAGIACATADYRHSLEAPFPAQLHDLKAAVRYLREFADELNIDPDRFGAWGESAGGHLVALLGLTGNRDDLDGGLGCAGAPQRRQRRRRLLRCFLAGGHSPHEHARGALPGCPDCRCPAGHVPAARMHAGGWLG